VRLQLPAETASVERARRAVHEFLAPHALTPQQLYAVEVVLEEVLMNIVMHAFPEPAGHCVRLAVSVDDERVVLRFEDEGIAFDPLSTDALPRPAYIEQAEPGGLGLLFVRELSRSLVYERRGGRNVLTVALSRG
jgi:anti-sigma regulatory factor (Ser/Thr protein kinase)